MLKHNQTTFQREELPPRLVAAGIVELVGERIELGATPANAKQVAALCDVEISVLERFFGLPVRENILDAVGSKLTSQVLRTLRDYRDTNREGFDDLRHESLQLIDVGLSALLGHRATLKFLGNPDGTPLFQICMSHESRRSFHDFWTEYVRDLQDRCILRQDADAAALGMGCVAAFWSIAPVWVSSPVTKRENLAEVFANLLCKFELRERGWKE